LNYLKNTEMSKPENPQAFPCETFMEATNRVMSERDRKTTHPGMTLRDYFAGQALSVTDIGTGITAKGIANKCYSVADAMLKERKKHEE